MLNSAYVNLFFLVFLFIFLSELYYLIIFLKLLFFTHGLYRNTNQFLNCCCLSFRNKSFFYLFANGCNVIQNLFKGMKLWRIQSYSFIFFCFNAVYKPFWHDFLSLHKKHIVEHLKADYNLTAYKVQDSLRVLKIKFTSWQNNLTVL